MKLDLATIFGLVLGFAFVVAAITLGSDTGGFFDLPALLIVIGGTFALTMVCFSLNEVFRAQNLLLKALIFSAPDDAEQAKKLLELGQKARVGGLASIQNDITHLHEPFLRQGYTLAVDGTNPETIELILRGDTESMIERHERSVAVFRKAAEIAPGMGIIGTIIGLVLMLGNLDTPELMGPALATALLSLLYGAVMANMIFLPLATKLERNSRTETELRKLYTAALLSMARHENPRQLGVMLNAILPPSKRIQVAA